MDHHPPQPHQTYHIPHIGYDPGPPLTPNASFSSSPSSSVPNATKLSSVLCQVHCSFLGNGHFPRTIPPDNYPGQYPLPTRTIAPYHSKPNLKITHIHTCMHTCIHIYILAYTHIDAYNTYKQTYIHIFMHTYTLIYSHIY